MKLLREKGTTKSLCDGRFQRADVTLAGKSLQHAGDIGIWDNCDYLGNIEVYNCLERGIKLKFGDVWYGYADVTSLVQVIEQTTVEFHLKDAILAEAKKRGYDWTLTVEGDGTNRLLNIVDSSARTSTVYISPPGDKPFKIAMCDHNKNNWDKFNRNTAWAAKIIQDDIPTLVTEIESDMTTIQSFFEDIKHLIDCIIKKSKHNLTCQFTFKVTQEGTDYWMSSSLGTVDISDTSKTITVEIKRSPVERYDSNGYHFIYNGHTYSEYFTDLLADSIESSFSGVRKGYIG